MSYHISSLTTNSGYLRQAEIRFAPGLTCIIGARGTCKSTIVETIRFAFDCNPDRVAALCDTQTRADAPSTNGLIHETLETGTARCSVMGDREGTRTEYIVEREVGSEPRVYCEGIKEFRDRSILHAIEIYSQGELQAIAERDDLRLELIDRPNRAAIDELSQERRSASSRLGVVGGEIRETRARLEALRVELRSSGGLRDQLSALQRERPSLSDELLAQHEAYVARKTTIERLRRALESRSAILADLLDAIGGRPDFTATDDARSLREKAAEPLISKLEAFAGFLVDLRQEVLGYGHDDLNPLMEQLEAEFESRNAAYYSLRQQQQAVNDSLRREDVLKKQIDHLARLEQNFQKAKAQFEEHISERQQLRHTIDALNDKIYHFRLEQVDQINSRHGSVTVLTLQQGAHSAEYAERLCLLLQGSRLRNQDEVARELSEKVRPGDLIDLVESGNSQQLAALLNRDLGQMNRLVGYLVDSAGLYELESVVFEDRLEITMYDGEVSKPISQLSRGQMATALLPLILRTADYPLVFDQPEDDLDNRFVYRTLVEVIRQLKQQRQLIFVTHNANIPVLGEADRVIVMAMDTPKLAATPTCGTVDDAKEQILSLLEGGAEAFRRRQQQYGDLLDG